MEAPESRLVYESSLPVPNGSRALLYQHSAHSVSPHDPCLHQLVSEVHAFPLLLVSRSLTASFMTPTMII